jgi:hypothetical protein
MGNNQKVVEELRRARTPLADQCSKKIGGKETDKKNSKENDEENSKEDDGIVHVCSRAVDGYCSAYAFPVAKWKNGDCPLSDTELKTVVVDEQPKGKVRIGQQKQKKKR